MDLYSFYASNTYHQLCIINIYKQYHISQRNRVAIIKTRATPNYTVRKMLNELWVWFILVLLIAQLGVIKVSPFLLLGKRWMVSESLQNVHSIIWNNKHESNLIVNTLMIVALYVIMQSLYLINLIMSQQTVTNWQQLSF